MVGARVVEPLAIGQDHAKQRAQFEQLMPIAIVARQPRGIEAEHQPGIAQPDLGDQPLEAVSLGARRPRLAEILVDDADALARPAQPDGTVDKTILKLGAFLVLADLVDRGLAHIDVRRPGAVRRSDGRVARQFKCAHHGPATAPFLCKEFQPLTARVSLRLLADPTDEHGHSVSDVLLLFERQLRPHPWWPGRRRTRSPL